MKRRFALKRDIIRAFTGSMNLISPEVENHHEKVSFLAYRLAEILGMDEDQKKTVYYAGLLHDIGGVLQRGSLSLTDLETNAGEIVVYGASILKQFAVTAPYAPVILESQTPWHCVDTLPKARDEHVRLGQIVHLADAQNGFLSDKLVALLTDHYDSIDSKRNIESRAASKAYQESLKAGNSDAFVADK